MDHEEERTEKEIQMNIPVKQPKEVVRLQFDIRRAQLNVIDSLVEICGLSSKKELFSNSMALMKWAVQETKKGRRIASYDVDNDEIEMVALPALDLLVEPSFPNVNEDEEEAMELKPRKTIDRKPQLVVG